MIEEAYVSFEVAKLLKEKRFDEPCWVKYDNEGYLSFNHVGYINSEEPCDDFCALAPTHQMVMKWLREEKNIIVNIWYDGGDWNAEYYNDEDENFYLITCLCNSYEEAVEAALKYCLENLI